MQTRKWRRRKKADPGGEGEGGGRSRSLVVSNDSDPGLKKFEGRCMKIRLLKSSS